MGMDNCATEYGMAGNVRVFLLPQPFFCKSLTYNFYSSLSDIQNKRMTDELKNPRYDRAMAQDGATLNLK